MASFEVDLILREADVGEEVTFVLCYNPAGEKLMSALLFTLNFVISP